MKFCTKVRTFLRTHLSPVDCETVLKKEWVTEPCGHFLSSKEEIAGEFCDVCAKGWRCPTNYPAGGPIPIKETSDR